MSSPDRATCTECRGVLVVEDDAAIRETLHLALESEGHLVFTATNGKEALDYLGSRPPPCFVILDLMMPTMTGWEFLEIRKRSRRLVTIPVVVVSASVGASGNARLPPETDFMKKPFELDRIVDLVRQYCQPHGRERGTAA